MKERRCKVLKKYAFIITVGIAYLIWVLVTDLRIPCIFKLITRLECPGCGVTRMIASLALFDIGAAFGYNPFLLITAPVIVFCIIYPEVRYVREGKYTLGSFAFLPWVEIVIALVFCVVRNVL